MVPGCLGCPRLSARLHRPLPYISSKSVHDHEHVDVSKLYTEETRLLDVNAPDARNFLYGYNNRSSEIVVETAGVPVLILRPGVILGSHGASIVEPGWLTWWARPSALRLFYIRLQTKVPDAAACRCLGLGRICHQGGREAPRWRV
jgi:nucleoside-diphosphate-sugar epimerase